jgi:hypothetical protein
MEDDDDDDMSTDSSVLNQTEESRKRNVDHVVDKTAHQDGPLAKKQKPDDFVVSEATRRKIARREARIRDQPTSLISEANIQGAVSELNDQIKDAVYGYIYDGQNDGIEGSRIGASYWTRNEKLRFFNALAIYGKDDLTNIAKVVGKSMPEVRVYLITLEDASLEYKLTVGNKEAALDMRIAPAAVQLSSKLIRRLNHAAREIDRIKTSLEEQGEQRLYGNYWLLDQKIVEKVEKAYLKTKTLTLPEDRAIIWQKQMNRNEVQNTDSPEDEPDESHSDSTSNSSSNSSEEGNTLQRPLDAYMARLPKILQKIPPANLLRLPNLLRISSTVFMNAPNPRPWTTAGPSIRHAAFSDLHDLVVSVTKRIISVVLFQCNSRVRMRQHHGKELVPMVILADVHTALDILGMKRNAFEFWRKAPRRHGLSVVTGSRKKRHGAEKRFEANVTLELDVVEDVLGERIRRKKQNNGSRREAKTGEAPPNDDVDMRDETASSEGSSEEDSDENDDIEESRGDKSSSSNSESGSDSDKDSSSENKSKSLITAKHRHLEETASSGSDLSESSNSGGFTDKNEDTNSDRATSPHNKPPLTQRRQSERSTSTSISGLSSVEDTMDSETDSSISLTPSEIHELYKITFVQNEISDNAHVLAHQHSALISDLLATESETHLLSAFDAATATKEEDRLWQIATQQHDGESSGAYETRLSQRTQSAHDKSETAQRRVRDWLANEPAVKAKLESIAKRARSTLPGHSPPTNRSLRSTSPMMTGGAGPAGESAHLPILPPPTPAEALLDEPRRHRMRRHPVPKIPSSAESATISPIATPTQFLHPLQNTDWRDHTTYLAPWEQTVLRGEGYTGAAPRGSRHRATVERQRWRARMRGEEVPPGFEEKVETKQKKKDRREGGGDDS